MGFKDFMEQNAHGFILGVLAALITILFKRITDSELAIAIVIAGFLIGGFSTQIFNIQKDTLFNKQNILILVFIIAGIVFIGSQTGSFGLLDIFKPVGIGSTGAALLALTGNPWLIGGVLILSILSPLFLLLGLLFILKFTSIGTILTKISANFTLILIMVFILFVLHFLVKRRKP